MAKPEWGLKRACRDCGKRFYDFHRDPIVCPGCQAVFDPLALLRPRRARPAPAPAPAPASKVEEAAPEQDPPETGDDDAETEDIAVEDSDIDGDAVIDTEDDEGMIKDTADLGDDDIPEVIDDDGQ